MQTLTTSSGVIVVPLQLETIGGVRSVVRYGPSRETLLKRSDSASYASMTDQQLLDAAGLLVGTHIDLQVEDINVSPGVVERGVTQLKKEVVLNANDVKVQFPSASDEQLMIAAIGKTGTSRMRYFLTGTPTIGLGTVTVTFSCSATS